MVANLIVFPDHKNETLGKNIASKSKNDIAA